MKKIKICASVLLSVMALSALTACAGGNGTSGSQDTQATQATSAEATVNTDATEASNAETAASSGETVASEVTEASNEATENSEETERTTEPSKMEALSGDDQTYANTFITNFAEQNFFMFSEAGRFEAYNAKIEDVLSFVYYHIKINAYKEFGNDKKGECSYVTVSYEKAASVVGKYMSYMLKEEDCKALPAPPDKLDNFSFGPFYEDGKIWFVTGDGDTFRNIGIVDCIEYNADGTATLYFTIYNIDFDVFESLDDAGLKKYYSLSPAQAESDKSLTKRGTGIANVSLGQSGKYFLNTYEAKV